MNQCDVWIQKIDHAVYPQLPFHPQECYPEFKEFCYDVQCSRKNEVYGAVREILHQLGYDKAHYGTEKWNPLKGMIKNGSTVLIKPNFVRGTHIWGKRGVQAMVTNASVIRPIIDYVLLATDGDVRLIIGDAPMRGSDWSMILKASQINELLLFYKEKGYPIQLIDFRKYLAVHNKDQIYEKTVPNPGRKPDDYIEVDMKRDSMLCEIIDSREKFSMGGIKKGTIKKYHNKNTNSYLFPKEVLEADVFINVPKLKTHRMAGLTCAMKNLIGINGEKERIAHYRSGVKSEQSDEFEKLYIGILLRERIWAFLKKIEKPWSRKLMTLSKRFVQKYVWKGKTFEETYALNPPKQYREGGWQGNDTLWRCVADINRILLYADKNGILKNEIQREYLCLVDAVIAGEGEGPLANTPKNTGIVMGGTNPVMVDFAAAIIMNFDYRLLPAICRSFEKHKYLLVSKRPDDINIKSNVPVSEYSMDFVPTSGWNVLYRSR